MDVLRMDKTGTIMLNQLARTGVIPLEYATESDVPFACALASQEANQDPIDPALLAATFPCSPLCPRIDSKGTLRTEWEKH